MRRNLTEEEFNKWREKWMREKGCPFFTCAKALFRKECGTTDLCPILFSYKDYKIRKWSKVCDEKLVEDNENIFPTKICPSCTGSLSLKVDSETGEIVSQSWCKFMNDFYEKKGFKVDRKNEKYIMSMGTFFIPIIGEEAYLDLINNPDKVDNILNEIKQLKKNKGT